MSDLFIKLQERYQALVVRREKDEVAGEFLEEVSSFIGEAQQAGATVADVGERSQLRAWMRFLANVVYDATSSYPDTSLQPLTRGQLTGRQAEREEERTLLPPLSWILVGGAAAIIIAVGLVALGKMSPALITETPTPAAAVTHTPTPAPFVSQVAVGAGLSGGGALKAAADTFCLGVSEISAEFALEDIQPEAKWSWEVQREGEVVASQPETPWGRDDRRAISILTGGPKGVDPGRYELLVYADEQVMATHSFQVLDAAPRVFNLQMADVPEPPEEASARSEFEAGVRVIYLTYEYEGLCPGLDLTYKLYHEGEPIQDSTETWNGSPQGQAQVSFQAPGDQPFSPGDYETAVTVAGEKQHREEFTIEKLEAAVRPAFGDVTVALGVQPDGTPILTAPDNRFDWRTKVVYAIFDYVGMSDGLRWAAVWMRNDQEVARQEGFWDVEAFGARGTRWVAHYDESGRALPGGNYSVTLYIENVAQQMGEFNIRYYVP